MSWSILALVAYRVGQGRHDRGDDRHAYFRLQRHHRFGVKLHGGDRQALVLDRHNDAVRGFGGDRKRWRQSAAHRVERMIPPDDERAWQAAQYLTAAHPYR